MTSTDRLRSLVKEATPETDPFAEDTDEREQAHALLTALAPQLALLVADMAEALKDWEYDALDDFLASKSVEFESRLAALFPEDSA